MTVEERAACYTAAFPLYPACWASRGWLLGVWNIGNNYRGSGYYGAYPPSYLARIMSLFPDARKVLHLFSGSLPPGPYVRFDVRADLQPDVVGQAEELSRHFPANAFDLILADPPYSESDAARYGQPLVNRNRVVAECARVLLPGGHLCWMDQVLPMYRRTEWRRFGEIYISRSTNHRVRGVFLFQRLAPEQTGPTLCPPTGDGVLAWAARDGHLPTPNHSPAPRKTRCFRAVFGGWRVF